MLDVFIRKGYKDLSASEVSRLADIDPSTFHRNIDELVEAEIVEETREVGNAQFYQINKENPTVQILAKARDGFLENLDHVPSFKSDRDEIVNISDQDETSEAIRNQVERMVN
jgi:DNA-binding transcriptional ArsR family regulator